MSPSRRAQQGSSVTGGIAGLRRYSVVFAVALLALAVAESALFVGQRIVQHWQDHSREVGTLARDALAVALGRNGAAYADLVSAGPASAIPSPSGRQALDSTLRELDTLTADNPAQQARVRAIMAAVQQWDTAFVRPAAAGRLSGSDAVRRGGDAFAPVQTAFARFLTAEDVLYDNRRTDNLLLGLVALAAMLVPAALLAGLVVASGRRFAAQGEQLVAQQAQLEEQAVELEQQVQELELANRELAEAVAAEKKERERAGREAAERARNAALLDGAMTSSPIGLSLLDNDLRYVRVNRAIGTITGLAPEDHVGRTLREVNPRLSSDVEAVLRRVVETGEAVQNLEMLRDGAPGTALRHLLLNVYPIRTSDGTSLGLGVAAVDTTEQRALLAQFHHAQKLEAVGRLAAGIAHDFNNLLTVIRSSCDLALLEIPEDAPGREEIREIRAAGERAAALSRQMVALSRKQTIIPRALAVGEALNEMTTMLRRVTGDRAELDVHLDVPLGIVHIDPTHLEQVLMNLVVNAVDAMPAGGRISIEATNVDVDARDAKRLVGLRPGPHVAITVRDSGTGIDAETLAKIFEPFFTTKPAGEGTGLGLSTVYGIVRDAGGYVHVESAVGRGTAFVIYLPAEVAEAVPAVRQLTPRDTGRVPAGGHETVMVVEDEDAVRTALTRLLARRGYVVLAAAHGGEALRVASEHDGPIDLVLTDFHMPGMHGRELIARLSDQRPGLRALFMSGSSEDSGLGEAAPAMTQPFIGKPFTVDELATAVRRVLDG